MKTSFDATPFADLLTQAEAAFRTDSAYAVAVAEAGAGIRAAAANREDPEQLKADILRLHSQGAGIAEIARIVHTSRDTIVAVIRSAPEPEPEPEPEARPDARDRMPAERPVTVSKKRTRRASLPMADDDPRHGTPNGYRNLRCRCAPCTEAHRVDKARRRAEGPKGNRATTADHGTLSKYQNGCRCTPCRAASTEFAREYRARKKGAEKLGR